MSAPGGVNFDKYGTGLRLFALEMELEVVFRSAERMLMIAI